jgi:hypothetical protein
MNRMTAAVVLMVLLALFMLAGAFPSGGGTSAAIFKTPVFIGLAGLLAGLILYCSWKGGLGFRRIGFLLVHMGVVVILVGALVGWRNGEKHDFALPIGPGDYVREIQLREGGSVPLPFGMACHRFSVEFYEPQAEFPVPRLFLADMAIQIEGEPVREEKLAVNHPIEIKGWRFYLMSYDSQNRTYVVLTARRDPGRLVVVTGIWMVIAGTVMLGVLGLGVGRRGRHEGG